MGVSCFGDNMHSHSNRSTAFKCETDSLWAVGLHPVAPRHSWQRFEVSEAQSLVETQSGVVSFAQSFHHEIRTHGEISFDCASTKPTIRAQYYMLAKV